MKKFISLLLAVCMGLSVGVMLTACDEEHEHTYKTEWAKGTIHHWHECEGETCLEVSDKAEHTWNEGEITTDPTAEADGEKTFTCTVCNATKDEPVEFTGISEEKWQESLAEQKFDNVTVNYSFENPEITQLHIVKIVSDTVYREVTVTMGNSEPMTMNQLFTGDEGISQRDMFLDIFLSLLAERDNFVWDKETGIYIAPNEVTVTVSLGDETLYGIEVMTNGKAKFDVTGKLEYFSCTLKETIYMNGELANDVTGNVIWTFSDYGTTVISETAE